MDLIYQWRISHSVTFQYYAIIPVIFENIHAQLICLLLIQQDTGKVEEIITVCYNICVIKRQTDME